MRVAALYDIHANPVALRAVLAQLEREQVDLIVVGGDAVPGPLPRPTIELLERSATAPSSCAATRIAGPSRSSTRWPGSAPIRPRAERPAAAWTATMIDQGQRDFLASFQEPLVIDVDGLGATLFCHGSPRSDEEILTLLTPEGRWAPMFAGVEQRLVVCGHTHAQSDRYAPITTFGRPKPSPRRRLARRRRLPAQLVPGARRPAHGRRGARAPGAGDVTPGLERCD